MSITTFATRFLLPLELALAWSSMGWALAGLLGAGVFAQTLRAAGLGHTWLWLLLVWGVASFVVSGIELLRGRAWGDARLGRWCLARSWLAWCGLVVWTALATVTLLEPIMRYTLALTWCLPMYLVGCAVCWVLDRRTALLLDPRERTERLRERLIAERDVRLQR